jgi:PAS domain S-box-containing protein
MKLITEMHPGLLVVDDVLRSVHRRSPARPGEGPAFATSRSRSQPPDRRDFFRGHRLTQRATQVVASLGLWLLLLASPLLALDPERKADGYSIQAWFTEQGLPSNKIRAITQARDGYLWLATAQGIARFDGSRFTVFSPVTHPELPVGGYHTVLEAPDGTLWFGGDHGLFHWHDGRFDRLTTADGLAHNYVRWLSLMRDGTIVACTRGGYSFLRGGKLTTPGGAWQQTAASCRAFLERRDGTFLLGTEDALWKVSGETVEKLSGTPELSGREFNSILEMPDGSAWIGYNRGVHRILPDGKRENYGPAEGLTFPRVSTVRADREGNIWIGVSAGGLFRLAHGRVESATYRQTFDVASIQDIHEDREGSLWLAGATGLFRLKDNVSGRIGTADGLAQSTVFSVFESSDHTWWIGLLGGGLYRHDRQSTTRLPVPPGLGLDQVIAFTEDPAGTLWIGSVTGLYRHVAGVTTNLYHRDQAAAWLQQLAARPGSTVPGIAHARTNSIAPDGEGGLWVATDGALYRGREGAFRTFTAADGVPGTEFKSVRRARDGDVWVAVPPLGIAQLHGDRWTFHACGAAVSAGAPRSIFEDRTGAIWVTTEGGGLNRFKDGKWRVFTTRDGLAHNFISSLVDDAAGNLWIACAAGVMRLPAAQFEELDTGQRTLLQPHLFNRYDGLPTAETNHQGSPSATRTRDNRLLFATDSGVAVVQPDNLPSNRLVPPVYIERLLVNGTPADLARPVSVPPGTNAIAIDYTALSLLAPEKVQFKIRLAPLDADWVDAAARREIRYNKLPPGHYQFSVIACNNDGVWNDRGATIAFSVQPFFYQTAWFIWLVSVGGVAGILGIFWMRARTARRQMKVLEGLVEARTRELQVAKEAAEAAVIAEKEFVAALTQAQAETAREQARFKFIFEALPIGITWMARGDVTTRIVNPAHTQISGVSAQEAFSPDTYRQTTHPDDRVRQEALQARLNAGEIEHYSIEKRYIRPDGSVVWADLRVRFLRDPASGEHQEISTLVDLTERKRAEEELERLHRELMATSRAAGMAEVATGVLHNVGNVLNSVNVSATLVTDHVRHSKAANVEKLSALFNQHKNDLADFLTKDPRGQMIPDYLNTLVEMLAAEQKSVVEELDQLRKNIEHIKEIVAMQQSYARTSGVVETISVPDMVEDALRINSGSLARHDVQTSREYLARPVVTTDRHKVMQILINLVRNSKYACDESGRTDKRIVVRITADDQVVSIAVIDNGVGIPAENLTRIFNHGFTTRKHGHGFGLHSGALAAKELGGSLTAHSDGRGHGATFLLTLPCKPAHSLADAENPSSG